MGQSKKDDLASLGETNRVGLLDVDGAARVDARPAAVQGLAGRTPGCDHADANQRVGLEDAMQLDAGVSGDADDSDGSGHMYSRVGVYMFIRFNE